MSVTEKTPFDEAEWQAQERALRGTLPHDIDPRDTSYRRVVDALRSSPRSEPPADFAADVAKRVARHEAGIERLLSRILLAAFVVLSAILLAIHGGTAWQALNQGMADGGSGWVLAGAGCVALSWIASRVLGWVVGAGRRARVA